MTGTAKRLWGLDAVQLTIPAASMVVGAEGDVTFPLPSFVIEHEQGLIMFDTGFAPLACEDPRAYFGPFYDVYNPIASPEMRIDRQLAQLGFRTDDVTHVILSHSHSDHSGGLTMFPHAKFYAGPGEFDFAADHPAEGDKYFRYEDEIVPVLDYDWTTVTSPRHDLFGDGSVVMLHTPGHTPGELTLQVGLPSRTMVLTADTVHLRAGLDLMSPDPYDWDQEQSLTSLRQLAALEAEGKTLWIGHDPGDWARFGPLVAQE